MSSFASKDSNQISDAFYPGKKDIAVTPPHIINLNSKGIINFTSPLAREMVENNFKLKIKFGDNCMRIFPYSILSKFVKEFKQIISSKLPENFSCTYNNRECIVSLIPVFSASGEINQIQILLYFENEESKREILTSVNGDVIFKSGNYFENYKGKINNVLESITDGFFLLNNEGIVVYWNTAARNLLEDGKGGQILNRKFKEIFPVEEGYGIYQNYLEASTSRQKKTFEYYSQYLGKWLDINIYPGKEGVSFYFNDITDRKIIEEQVKIAQERYKLVSKATREAVYDWDISNNSLEWSDSYYEIYGYERGPGKLALAQWEQHIHFEDRERVVTKLQTALESGENEWSCEYRLLQANRKIAVILERGYIMRDEKAKAIRMIGALLDMTTLKQNERALEELNFQLKKHSAQLSQSNAELEHFAYIASHDLQEPLRMVTSFLKLLEKNHSDDLDDKAKKYIHFARDGAVRMRQIILDLLEYSRIGKLKYDLELVDVNVTIRDIQLMYENLILEKNVVIKYKNLPVIKAASTPLLRVLSNLINNSIKYTRNGISPIIKLEVKDIGSHWEFIVDDNGIGINDQFKEKIFVIFQRLHSRDEYSGTGIGLAICKKIVENHGGKIWVESKEGVGSSFHFTIQKHF